jgi:leucyl aminopeptidase
MKCSVVLRSEQKKWDAWVCGCPKGERASLASLGKMDRETQSFLEGIFQSNVFEGKEGEIFFSYLPHLPAARSVFLVGLGKRESYDLERMRRFLGRVMKQACKQKLSRLALDLKTLAPQKVQLKEVSRAATEALLLAGFRFTKYRSKANGDGEVKSADFVCDEALERRAMRSGMQLGALVGEATNLARELATEPANVLTPRVLAEKAKELAREAHLVCRIFDEKEIRKRGMGGLLGVSQGSQEPPRFIILETPSKSKSQAPVVLVGKGITFDSGGISIKPARGMEAMKYDMSGAAAVLATLWLVGKLKLPVKLVGIAPACENMPSEKPQRPGDVVTISNGKTVEVINTDAEGRMILADGLSYAAHYNPRYIIDVATLTGACRGTLGEFGIGIMGNHPDLLKAIKEAGEKSGERCWELPLWDDFKDHIKSDIADLKNIGRDVAGASIGGMFLKEFVGNYPWVHLDIASTGWYDSDHDYISKGASGAGVRLLFQFLADLIG